jgi:hypothetical protein
MLKQQQNSPYISSVIILLCFSPLLFFSFEKSF